MVARHHNLLLLSLAFALAAVAACSKKDSAPKGAAVVARAPEPWFMNPDEHCQFDSTTKHSDPEALVREFARRDEQGAFLRSDPWFHAAVECPGHERSPDTYSIVADAEVVPGRIAGDSARVGVRYTLLGVADVNGFRPDMRTVVDTVALYRSRFGWRLVSPAPMPHVTVDVAKKHQAFTRADSWALDAAITQARRFSPRR